jgi:hypothetical protein
MPTFNKQFTLNITVEQFLDNCSAIELQEVELLISSARYQNKMGNSKESSKDKNMYDLLNEVSKTYVTISKPTFKEKYMGRIPQDPLVLNAKFKIPTQKYYLGEIQGDFLEDWRFQQAIMQQLGNRLGLEEVDSDKIEFLNIRNQKTGFPEEFIWKRCAYDSLVVFDFRPFSMDGRETLGLEIREVVNEGGEDE